MAFAGFLLLGLGASGLAPWGLWLLGHKPPSLVWVSPEALSAGWVGLVAEIRVEQAFGMFYTWVWGQQLLSLWSWAPNLYV